MTLRHAQFHHAFELRSDTGLAQYGHINYLKGILEVLHLQEMESRIDRLLDPRMKS